jgi:hypothetical protein
MPFMLLWSAAAAVPFAVEQQDAPPSLSVEQQLAMPSFFIEHDPSLPPQQPFSPSLVLQTIPTAEHLQPSLVPPVVVVGLALASTMLGLFCATVAGLEVAAAGVAAAFELEVVTGLSAAPHPANPNTINESIAANFSFMIFLQTFFRFRVVKKVFFRAFPERCVITQPARPFRNGLWILHCFQLNAQALKHNKVTITTSKCARFADVSRDLSFAVQSEIFVR